MRIAKTLLGCTAALVLSGLLGIVVIDRVLGHIFPIERNIVSEKESPGGPYVATAYQTYCWTSTGSTIVNLHKADQRVKFDDDDANEVYVLDGLRDVSVNWTSPGSLFVTTKRWASDPRGGPKPIKKLEAWRDIRVLYGFGPVVERR